MCLGGNAKGCVERPDMQARLLEARAELLELRAAPAMQVPEFYSDELYPAAAATTPPPLPKPQQQTHTGGTLSFFDILGSAVSKKQTPSPPASPYAPAPLPSSPDCILWRMGQGIGMAAAQHLPPVSMAPKEFVSTAQVSGLHFWAPTLAPTQVCQWSCIHIVTSHKGSYKPGLSCPLTSMSWDRTLRAGEKLAGGSRDSGRMC
jgi:hypothetical protein